MLHRAWSRSYGGPDDGSETVPDETFKMTTCRNVDEAVEAALKIEYENGVMIKASEGCGGNDEDLRNAYIMVQNEVIGSPIFII